MSPKPRPRRTPPPVDPSVRFEIDDPQGGRNKIRAKDRVHVGPSRPGKRDGFDATFISAKEKDGAIAEVTVYGGPGQSRALRTFRPERIFRKAQTKQGVQR